MAGASIFLIPRVLRAKFFFDFGILKSDVRKLTENGLQTRYFGYEPANTALKLGVRGFW